MSGDGIISARGEGRCAHAVSDDENFVLEFPRVVWRKLLDGTGGPSIRGITIGGGYRQNNSSENDSPCTYPRLQTVPTSGEMGSVGRTYTSQR